MWYQNPYYKNPADIASFNNESTLRFQTMQRAKYIRTYINQLAKYHFHDTGENSPLTKNLILKMINLYFTKKVAT